ncbi:MAG: hypothetical protein HY744_04990 [Deltaproteobacteria bacterium]|nr:hypothetical protein [Deltaproteobacteria bacterium]
MNPRIITLAAAYAVALAGCQTEVVLEERTGAVVSEIGKPCEPEQPDSCPPHLECNARKRQCSLPQCYTSKDCEKKDLPDDSQCVNLHCTLPGVAAGVGTPCGSDADCPRYLACRPNGYGTFCQEADCYRAEDCDAGQICIDLACLTPGYCK